MYIWSIHTHAVFVCTLRPEEVTGDHVLCLMPLRQGLSLNLELLVICFWSGIVLVRMTGQPAPSSILCLVPQPKHWGHKYAWPLLTFYMDTGDQNSGSHA